MGPCELSSCIAVVRIGTGLSLYHVAQYPSNCWVGAPPELKGLTPQSDEHNPSAQIDGMTPDLLQAATVPDHFIMATLCRQCMIEWAKAAGSRGTHCVLLSTGNINSTRVNFLYPNAYVVRCSVICFQKTWIATPNSLLLVV